MSADPVPPRVRDILAIFETELSSARFGDLDHALLAELAEQARERAREVEEARAALDAAHAALEEARAELARRAEQGLAYAKVFAEGNEDVAAQLAAIDASDDPAPRPARRGRKKNGTGGDELPFAGGA